jgi:two-component system, chemotaxis family, chemotaxis protein CheY
MLFDFAPLRVLIVDDHNFTRLLIREVLQNLGCSQGNIFEAEDGSAALQVLKEQRVHLIICDWQMEPMDGLTFIRAIRDPKKSTDPFVPVVLCSAYTQRDLIERARDLGVTEIMTKPITVKAIEEKVRTVIESPRPFVDSTQYFGPDRRRRAENGPPTEERRKKRRTVVKQVEDPDLTKRSD